MIVLASYLSKLYSIPNEEQTSYTVYLLYSLHHTTTDKLHCIFTVSTAPHNNRQVTLYIYCIHCTTQQQTSYTLYLLYSLHHTTTNKLHCISTVFTVPHNNRQVALYIYCIYCTTQQQTSYNVYLLYSLHHTITLYCTAVLVESLIFLLYKLESWQLDVRCLAKARMCCLVKCDGISNGVAMDVCEVMVKWGC